MSTDAPVEWAELAPQLVDAARQDRAGRLTIVRELVGPADRLAGDIGCGTAGIRAEWSDPRVPVEPLRVDVPADTATLRKMLGAPADLGCASAAVHHAGDQQAAMDTLARRIAWLRPANLLTAADLDVWDRLRDPTDGAWLGQRYVLFRLSARSAHLGVCP
ncbi:MULTISPECIES: hypothetical protein [unclassified Micromonospora]|uniref:hypothetical protein n=1 Tax=unclassified Micromonospora TaxID=2617518 RepID=UPI003631134B